MRVAALRFRAAILTTVLAALAGCAPTIVPQPGGGRPPAAPPPPAPAPVVQGPDWQDWAMASGTWSYRQEGRFTTARFTAPAGGVQAWVRCDTTTHRVAIGRTPVAVIADGGNMMTIRTTFGVLLWPMSASPQGGPVGLEAVRTASDPGLDQIAFSRGRFTIEQPGQPVLVLPTWAEPVRVVEDCRG